MKWSFTGVAPVITQYLLFTVRGTVNIGFTAMVYNNSAIVLLQLQCFLF